MGPVAVEVRLALPPGACVQVEPYGAGRGFFSGLGAEEGLTRDEGALRVAQRGVAEVTASVDAASRRWQVPFEVGRPFDLEACRLAHTVGVAGGDLVRLGSTLLPTQPGLYVLEQDGTVRFDATYGGLPAAPASCDALPSPSPN